MKPEKKGDASQELEQDMTILDDLESELSEPLDEEFLEINSGRMKSSR